EWPCDRAAPAGGTVERLEPITQMRPAFGRRGIPPGGVAPRSNTPGILVRRAWPVGRRDALGATASFVRWVLLGRGLTRRQTRTPAAQHTKAIKRHQAPQSSTGLAGQHDGVELIKRKRG